MDWVRSTMLSVCQIKILMLSMNSLIHLYCRNMKVGDTFFVYSTYRYCNYCMVY